MGYPTSLSATHRSRAATGLSNVVPTVSDWATEMSEFLKGAKVSPSVDDEFSEMLSRSVEDVRSDASLRSQMQEEFGDLLSKPVHSDIPEPMEQYDLQEGPKRSAAPSSSTGPRSMPRYNGPGMPLGALSRGMNAAGWFQLAAWALDELHEWNEMRQFGNAAARTATWTWPPPEDYGEGSTVVTCAGTSSENGPFGGTSICGIVEGHDFEEEPYVHYGGGSWPDGNNYVDVVTWHLVDYLSPPSTASVPSVMARYKLLGEDGWPYIPEEEQPPNNQPMPWWPVKSVPGFGEGPAPDVPSMLDPESLPVTSSQPRGTPVPPRYATIPRIGNNPWRSPKWQNRRGNVWPPDPWPDPFPQPKPEREPWRRPVGVPEHEWERHWDRRPLPLAPPAVEVPGGKTPAWGEHPPGPKVKERKMAVNAVWVGLLRGALAVTEAQDFIDAWHDALPKRFQTPNATAAEKWQDLYKNWDEVSVEKGVENTIVNAIEDAVIGAVEGTITTAMRRGNITPDWQNNPTKPDFEESLAEAVDDAVRPIVEQVVPELDT